MQPVSQELCPGACVDQPSHSQPQDSPNPPQLKMPLSSQQECGSPGQSVQYDPLRTREGSKVTQGREARACGRTYQSPLQFEATNRRRSTPPCASPVMFCSGADLCGSCQPLAVDSMARWTSTRPMVVGEEAVPRNACTASATGAAPTVASRVVRTSFGDARRPFEGGPESGAGVARGLVGLGRTGPVR